MRATRLVCLAILGAGLAVVLVRIGGPALFGAAFGMTDDLESQPTTTNHAKRQKTNPSGDDESSSDYRTVADPTNLPTLSRNVGSSHAEEDGVSNIATTFEDTAEPERLTASTDVPTCWIASSSLRGSNDAAETFYAVERDSEDVVSGETSVKLFSMDDRAPHGVLRQTVSAARFAGRQLEFSAFIKTSMVLSGVKLWLIAIDASGRMVAEEGTEWMTGSMDWYRSSVTAYVPKSAASITFAVRLLGTGAVWVDGVRVVLSDAPENGTTISSDEPTGGFWPPPTASDMSRDLENLDFEDWPESAGECRK